MEKYNLVIALDLENLIEITNKAIEDGYEPIGGIQLIEGKLIQSIYKKS